MRDRHYRIMHSIQALGIDPYSLPRYDTDKLHAGWFLGVELYHHSYDADFRESGFYTYPYFHWRHGGPWSSGLQRAVKDMKNYMIFENQTEEPPRDSESPKLEYIRKIREFRSPGHEQARWWQDHASVAYLVGHGWTNLEDIRTEMEREPLQPVPRLVQNMVDFGFEDFESWSPQ